MSRAGLACTLPGFSPRHWTATDNKPTELSTMASSVGSALTSLDVTLAPTGDETQAGIKGLKAQLESQREGASEQLRRLHLCGGGPSC